MNFVASYWNSSNVGRSWWLCCVDFTPGKAFKSALPPPNDELEFLIFTPFGILSVKRQISFLRGLMKLWYVLTIFWFGFCGCCVLMFWVGCCYEWRDIDWEFSCANFFWILNSTDWYDWSFLIWGPRLVFLSFVWFRFFNDHVFSFKTDAIYFLKMVVYVCWCCAKSKPFRLFCLVTFN